MVNGCNITITGGSDGTRHVGYFWEKVAGTFFILPGTYNRRVLMYPEVDLFFGDFQDTQCVYFQGGSGYFSIHLVSDTIWAPSNG